MDIAWGIAISSFAFALYFGWKTYESRKLAHWHESQLFEQSNEIRYELDQSQMKLAKAEAQIERMQRLHSEIISQRVSDLEERNRILCEAVKAGKENEDRLEKCENEAKRTALEREETLKKQIQELYDALSSNEQSLIREKVEFAKVLQEAKEREKTLLQELNRLTELRKVEDNMIHREIFSSQDCGESLEIRCEFLKNALIAVKIKNEEDRKTISAALAEAQAKNEISQSDIRALQLAANQMLAEKHRFQTETAQQQSELTQTLSKSECQLRKANQQLSVVKEEFARALQERDAIIAVMQKSNSELTMHIANASQEKIAMQNQINMLKSQSDSLKSAMVDEQRKCESMRLAAKVDRAANEKTAIEVAALRKQNKEIMERAKNAEQLKKNLDAVNKKFVKMQKEAQESASTIQYLTEQLQESQNLSQQFQYSSERSCPKCAESERSMECVICFDNPKSILFEPCRHICVCEPCSKQIHECPLCKRNIKRRKFGYLG